jgi:Transposase, Mutator family
MSEDDGLKAMGHVIQIDEARIRDHLGEMVRGTVEETLNALVDAEADRLCGAGRYERTQGRQDTRAGSYERSLHTVAGEVNLKVPKLRRQTFETAIISPPFSGGLFCYFFPPLSGHSGRPRLPALAAKRPQRVLPVIQWRASTFLNLARGNPHDMDWRCRSRQRGAGQFGQHHASAGYSRSGPKKGRRTS